MPRQIRTKLRFLVLGIGLTVMAAYPAPTQVVQPSAVDAAYVPTLTFDVASVKEDDPASPFHQGFQNPLHSSLYIITDFWPTQLIAGVYGNLNYRTQVLGGPDWSAPRDSRLRRNPVARPMPGWPSSPTIKPSWKSSTCC